MELTRTTSTGPRIPLATYRLQFNAGFGFSTAADIVPYLEALGISDVYASPYFKSRPGSMHGYDVLDQNRLNDEVGTREEYDVFTAALQQRGMGQLLDIVPNHMCVEGSGNSYWMDLLENGPSSPYAAFFDIDWHPVKQELENKILLPILGDQYGTVLENGELSLVFGDGIFQLAYYEHRFPIIPKTYAIILNHDLERLEQRLPPDSPQMQELLSIITALRHLPPTTEIEPARIAERYREKEIVKRRLWTLSQESREIRDFIEKNLECFNGTKGDSASFDLLDGLLREQVYRISDWRVATEEINYRRFFDINALGAIRTELPDVFRATHQLVFRLVQEGKVTGLRVDHADGLRDPAEYFRMLQQESFLALCNRALEGAPPGAGEEDERRARLLESYAQLQAVDTAYRPLYIVGEKILAKNERLPEEWRIFSTTGYEFANLLNGLFVDSDNARAFDTLYHRFSGQRCTFADVVYEKKKLVMQVSLSSEINTLGHYLNTISELNRHTRDFTLNSLVRALVEVIAFFPVYRTYTSSFEVAERDRLYVEAAVSRAKRKNPATSTSIFDFVRDVLLLRFPDSMDESGRRMWLDFVMRFQQITGPVMAKGVEDTTFYIYNRLTSLNEVGGMPERFGISLEAFHGQNFERSKAAPLAMLSTSTHDTKRSEDVRARINVLSEIPATWRDAIGRWSRMNRKFKATVDGQPVPSRNEEYFLYQTLVGSWPLGELESGEMDRYRQRIQEYLMKALREAKVNSSWISPNYMYEDALRYFVDTLLRDRERSHFVEDFSRFQRRTALCGMLNALSQTLLKMTAPGLPDFYQGSELWDLSLVDPDNRRPVDFGLRRRLLDNVTAREEFNGSANFCRELLEFWEDGRVKLQLIRKVLNFRREQQLLFEKGRYLPLEVQGVRSRHVCAFERYGNEGSVIVVAPRFFYALTGGGERLPLGEDVWGDTEILLPDGDKGRPFRNLLTSEEVRTGHEGAVTLRLAEILGTFPVALLHR